MKLHDGRPGRATKEETNFLNPDLSDLNDIINVHIFNKDFIPIIGLLEAAIIGTQIENKNNKQVRHE